MYFALTSEEEMRYIVKVIDNLMIYPIDASLSKFQFKDLIRVSHHFPGMDHFNHQLT